MGEAVGSEQVEEDRLNRRGVVRRGGGKTVVLVYKTCWYMCALWLRRGSEEGSGGVCV